jgi:signal peptidase I
MNKFKVGDIVRIAESSCFHGKNYYNPADKDGIVIDSNYTVDYRYRVDWGGGQINRYRGEDLYLVENKKEKEMPDTEKKYKITTELSLQEVTDLKRALSCSSFVELHKELSIIYREAQRNVVKVGGKEYYEDELSAALANINAIEE